MYKFNFQKIIILYINSNEFICFKNILLIIIFNNRLKQEHTDQSGQSPFNPRAKYVFFFFPIGDTNFST